MAHQRAWEKEARHQGCKFSSVICNYELSNSKSALEPFFFYRTLGFALALKSISYADPFSFL